MRPHEPPLQNSDFSNRPITRRSRTYVLCDMACIDGSALPLFRRNCSSTTSRRERFAGLDVVIHLPASRNGSVPMEVAVRRKRRRNSYLSPLIPRCVVPEASVTSVAFVERRSKPSNGDPPQQNLFLKGRRSLARSACRNAVRSADKIK